MAGSMNKKRTTIGQKSLWEGGEFPEDVMYDVLSKVPVKSLLRFRSVSKKWRALIDDPDFARFHLTSFNNNRLESQVLVVHGTRPPHECILRSSNTLRSISKVCILQSLVNQVDQLITSRTRDFTESWNILSSIDGVFLLESIVFEIPNLLLWNPSIRKTLIIPPSSPEIPSQPTLHYDLGIGFDPSIEDYKCVRVSMMLASYEFNSILVYTLGTNSWKTINEFQGDQHIVFDFSYQPATICFRGALYTFVRHRVPRTFRLVSFDLSSEMFSSASLPGGNDRYTTPTLTLTDYGCSLAVVNMTDLKGSIWVSQGVGADIDSFSWTCRYTFDPMISIPDILDGRTKFLFLNNNGEMLFKRRTKVTSYDLEALTEKVLLKSYLHSTWAYMESLLLLTS